MCIEAVIADNHVVTLATAEDITTTGFCVTSQQYVVAVVTPDVVVIILSDQEVITVAAVDVILAAITEHRVVSGSSVQLIRSGTNVCCKRSVTERAFHANEVITVSSFDRVLVFTSV